MIAYIQFETVEGATITTTLERILFVKTVIWPNTKAPTAYIFIMGLEKSIEVDLLIGDKICQLMRSASNVEAILNDSLDGGKFKETARDSRDR